MDTNTLSPKVAAAAIASTHASNRNLSTDPKRMAVIKVWDSMMRGARKYCEQEGFVTIHNMPARVAQFILGQTDIRECRS